MILAVVIRLGCSLYFGFGSLFGKLGMHVGVKMFRGQSGCLDPTRDGSSWDFWC